VNSLVESCQSRHSVVSTTWMWFLSCLVGMQFMPSSRHHDSAAVAAPLVRWPLILIPQLNIAHMAFVLIGRLTADNVDVTEACQITIVVM